MKNPARKRYLLVVTVLCILTLPALAAGQNPDLSGTWILNEAESKLPEAGVSGGGGRSGRGVGGGLLAPQLTITREGDEITFDRSRTDIPQGRQQGRVPGGQAGPQKVKIDGKPHDQQSGRGTSTVVADWKEGKLVVVQTRSSGSRGSTKTTMEYSLDEDGKKLTIVYEMENPQGTVNYKLVYDKKE